MLSFELCQRLKEAGFPQRPTSDASIYELDGILKRFRDLPEVLDLNLKWILVPTIEDLLRELPKKHDEGCSLNLGYVTDTLWMAWYGHCDFPSADVTGKTPEEALALLYLALKE